LALFGQFIQGLATRDVNSFLVIDYVLVTNAAVGTDFVEWNFTAFQQLHEEWARHIEYIRSILRCQFSMNRDNAYGIISIKLACLTFGISQTCYRYQPKLSAENMAIADHLIRLTHNQRNWGFGLCFLYLRNVKGYPWNHKRV
jgi:hypothetical protein